MASSVCCIIFLLFFVPSFMAQDGGPTGGNLSNCKGGCSSGLSCIGNAFSQPVPDEECSACASSKTWWPCNFETLCFCASSDARIPPAPKSGLVPNTIDVCSMILTETIFNQIVIKSINNQTITSDASTLGRALYTYQGLCDAIMAYNMYHDEKFANMGDEMQIRAELAAFLAHVAVDTRGFSVVREEMHCVNPITGTDGNVYCMPCREENYDASTRTCTQGSLTSVGTSYTEYCDETRQPPQGCECPADYGVMAADSTIVGATGYVAASQMFFERGAIVNSWNYDYYGASQALTGDGNTLCLNPDLVSTNPQMAWGAGIYKFMEKMKFGTTGSTAHKQAVRGNFGGTVEVLYGEMECPSGEWISGQHQIMVRERVAQICSTGATLGVMLEMDECDDGQDNCLICDGLKDIFDACILDGSCPDCQTWSNYVMFVSDAPTVTPLKIIPPDDWGEWNDGRGGSNCGRIMGASYWLAATLTCVGLFLHRQ